MIIQCIFAVVAVQIVSVKSAHLEVPFRNSAGEQKCVVMSQPAQNPTMQVRVRFIIVLQIVRYSPHKFLNLLLTTAKTMSERSLYGVVSEITNPI